MTLIPCPDCGHEVSERAPACPHCGSPIQATTIEATSKKWKAYQGIGAAVTVVGVIGFVAGQGSPGWGFILIVGFSLAIVGKLGAWWHNE